MDISEKRYTTDSVYKIKDLMFTVDYESRIGTLFHRNVIIGEVLINSIGEWEFDPAYACHDKLAESIKALGFPNAPTLPDDRSKLIVWFSNINARLGDLLGSIEYR